MNRTVIVLSRLLALLALVLLASPCRAATLEYWVDANSGSDGNAGSSGAPWQTFDKAMTEVTAAGFTITEATVHLAAGQYSGKGQFISHDYNPAASLKILGAGKHVTTLTSASFSVQNVPLLQIQDITLSRNLPCMLGADISVNNVTVNIHDVDLSGGTWCRHMIEVDSYVSLNLQRIHGTDSLIYGNMAGTMASYVTVQHSTFVHNATKAQLGASAALELNSLQEVQLRNLTFEGTPAMGAVMLKTYGPSSITDVTVECEAPLFNAPVRVLQTTQLSITGLHVSRCITSGDGGALHIDSSSLTIGQSSFSHNTAAKGGAVVATCPNPPPCVIKLENTTMTNNTASGHGGCLHAHSDLSLRNVSFADSSATDGGAIFVSHGTVMLQASTIRNCEASLNGGAIRVTGGAVALGSGAASEDVLIEDCRAVERGGGVSVTNAALYLRGVTLRGCMSGETGGGVDGDRLTKAFGWQRVLIEHCSALASGGGVSMAASQEAASIELHGLTVKACTAPNGAGMSLGSLAGPLLIKDSLIEQCTATVSSGGLHAVTAANISLVNLDVKGCSASFEAGGLHLQNSHASLVRVNVSSCHAQNSGGILLVSTKATAHRSTVVNCRATKAYGGGISMLKSALTASDMTLENNYAATNGGALFGTVAHLNMSRATITDNIAVGVGGGVSCGHCTLDAIAATVFSNIARLGGGLSTTDSDVRVVGGSFTLNNAGEGAAAYFAGSAVEVGLGCKMNNNTAIQTGGAMTLVDCNRVKLHGSEFRFNKATQGPAGAIMARESLDELTQSTASTYTLDMHDCVVKNNRANGVAGGMMVDAYMNSRVTMRRNVFSSNVVTSGLLNVFGRHQGGGALALDSVGHLNTPPQIEDNTFADNSAVQPANVAVDAVATGGGAVLMVRTHAHADGNTFTRNAANFGGAVGELVLDVKGRPTNISGNAFTSNHAAIAGGALFWFTVNPHMLLSGNTYSGNTVPPSDSHGTHYATTMDSINIEPKVIPAQGSGQQIATTISVELLDAYSQVVGEASGGVAILTSTTSDVSLAGSTSATIHQGRASFSKVTIIGPLGGTGGLEVSVAYDGITRKAVSVIHFRNCLIGETAVASQCVPCKATTFAWEVNPPSCLPCPTGGVCQGSEVLVQKDYYRSHNRSRGIVNVLRGTYSFMPCLSPFACNGAANGSDYDFKGFEGCSKGYKGALCLQCESGYGRAGAADCAPCASKFIMTLLVAAGIVLIALVAAFLVYSNMKNAGKSKSLLSLMTKTLLSFMQVVSLARSIHVNWPTPIVHLMSTFAATSSVSTQVFSLDCVVQPIIGPSGSVFMAKQLVMIVSPLLCALGACIFWGIVYLYKVTWKRRNHKLTPELLDTNMDGLLSEEELQSALCNIGVKVDDLQTTFIVELCDKGGSGEVKVNAGLGAHVWEGLSLLIKQSLTLTIVVTTFLVHPTVAKATMELFTCDPFDDGLTHLRGDMDVTCWQGRHMVWVLLVGLPSIVLGVCGIPAFAFMQLRGIQKSVGFDDIHARHRWGFLYVGLDTKYYYWEILIMIRKVGFVAIAVSLQAIGPQTAAMAAVLLLFVATLLHQIALPYEADVLDELERASLVCSFLLLFSASFFHSLEQESNTRPAWAALIVMLLCIVGFLVLWVYYAWREVARAAKVAISAVKQKTAKVHSVIKGASGRAETMRVTPKARSRNAEDEDDDDSENEPGSRGWVQDEGEGEGSGEVAVMPLGAANLTAAPTNTSVRLPHLSPRGLRSQDQQLLR